MNKATIRIPTDMYAYIEVSVEDTPENIIDLYRYYSKLFKGGLGLGEPDFQKVLDKYLWGDGSMFPEEYEGMSLEQQNVIQIIKRSISRNNYKLHKIDGVPRRM